MRVPPYAFGRRLPDTKIFGIRAQQDWSDLALWDRMLEDRPDLKTVIEIGTFLGGLSGFLSVECEQRNILFQTWDIQKWEGLDERLLNHHFHVGDALIDERLRMMLDDPDRHPLLIFCDGGDKPKEFATFAPLLQPGDVIGVHDYGQEIFDGDITPHMERLRPAALERHVAADSLTRFYRCVDREHGWGSIAIGVRISKYPEGQFFMSWSKLLTGGTRGGDTVLIPGMHLPAHWASDALVRQFLHSGRDTLLMLDDDQVFEMGDLEKIRENQANWQYDVVGALYTHRYWPPTPLIMQARDKQPGQPWCLSGEVFSVKESWEPGEVVPVDAMGLGFTLIRNTVLEEMADKSIDPELNFWFTYGPGHESDDIPFMRRARQLGFRLAIDTGVEIGHVGAAPLSAEHWRNHLASVQAKPHVDVDAGELRPILESYQGPLRDEAKRLLESIEDKK